MSNVTKDWPSEATFNDDSTMPVAVPPDETLAPSVSCTIALFLCKGRLPSCSITLTSVVPDLVGSPGVLELAKPGRHLLSKDPRCT